jgi:hypothetical protein
MKSKKYVFLLGIASILSSPISVNANGLIDLESNNSGQTCNSQRGVWVCNREAQGMPGNHSYVWDGRMGESCGMGGMSGYGTYNNPEKGPRGDSCNFVPLSEGQEDQIMNHCRANANNGLWVPAINDCHNAAEDSVTESDLDYPGAPGGRLGTIDYNDSGSPQWRESNGLDLFD